MPESNHSAEWLRGAVAALGEATGAVVNACWMPSLTRQQQIRLWDKYRNLLAAAEAREAGTPTAEEVIAACKRAVLQLGKWDQFSDREKSVAREAMQAIAAWEAARR